MATTVYREGSWESTADAIRCSGLQLHETRDTISLVVGDRIYNDSSTETTNHSTSDQSIEF